MFPGKITTIDQRPRRRLTQPNARSGSGLARQPTCGGSAGRGGLTRCHRRWKPGDAAVTHLRTAVPDPRRISCSWHSVRRRGKPLHHAHRIPPPPRYRPAAPPPQKVVTTSSQRAATRGRKRREMPQQAPPREPRDRRFPVRVGSNLRIWRHPLSATKQ